MLLLRLYWGISFYLLNLIICLVHQMRGILLSNCHISIPHWTSSVCTSSSTGCLQTVSDILESEKTGKWNLLKFCKTGLSICIPFKKINVLRTVHWTYWLKRQHISDQTEIQLISLTDIFHIKFMNKWILKIILYWSVKMNFWSKFVWMK